MEIILNFCIGKAKKTFSYFSRHSYQVLGVFAAITVLSSLLLKIMTVYNILSLSFFTYGVMTIAVLLLFLGALTAGGIFTPIIVHKAFDVGWLSEQRLKEIFDFMLNFEFKTRGMFSAGDPIYAHISLFPNFNAPGLKTALEGKSLLLSFPGTTEEIPEEHRLNVPMPVLTKTIELSKQEVGGKEVYVGEGKLVYTMPGKYNAQLHIIGSKEPRFGFFTSSSSPVHTRHLIQISGWESINQLQSNNLVLALTLITISLALFAIVITA